MPPNNKKTNEFEQEMLPEPVIGQDFVSSPNVIRTDKDLVVKDKIILSDVELNVKTGQKVKRRGISGSTHYAFNDDFYLGVTSLALAPTINLPRPSIVGFGKLYVVKDESGGAASTTITVVSVGGETIDGAASKTITTNYNSLKFITDGANWFIF